MMDTTSDLEELLAACYREPDEFDRYLVLADELELRGDELAATWRWMGENHRHPKQNAKHPTLWMWERHDASVKDIHGECAVPESIFEALKRTNTKRLSGEWYIFFEYEDEHEGWMAAIKALSLALGKRSRRRFWSRRRSPR